ncbi:MAG: hypothetical protein HRU19_04810 [Pseudobacteriovorax sp.]|nr:hypothetical protein [Pseudobacteriovorax sp.]
MSDFLHLLMCPNCKKTHLKDEKKALVCTSCGSEYPKTGNVAWLFENPKGEIADWQNRYHLFVDMTGLEVQKLKFDSQSPNISGKTKDRLLRLIQAKTEHSREVARILKPMDVKEEDGPKSESLVGGTELPSTQSLMGYYQNVCRDWSYGDQENAICLEKVEEVLKEDKVLRNMGVIGSGACRLAFDIHRKLKPSNTINTDINPYLLLVASRLIQGKSVSLYDFPIAPINLESTAVKLKCKAPEILSENFHYCLADGMNPVFAKQSLDSLLTPWLIDIVPQDLQLQALRYNHCLKDSGRWVNFGSLSFYHNDQKICYSIDEALEIVENSGFKIEAYSHDDIPYLHSPYSCQKRTEKVLTFSARKVESKEPPAEEFTFLPDWLTNTSQPVPRADKLNQQHMVHSMLGNVFSLVDDKNSIEDIAEAATFLKLPKDNAVAVIKNVLTKFFNDHQKGNQF